jgi:hypothetical protein
MRPAHSAVPEPTSSSQPSTRCRAFSLRDAAQEFGLIVPFMSQNRLDFRRKGRISVCVGRWTWLPADTIRARLAACGALGGASVNSDAATQRSPPPCRRFPPRGLRTPRAPRRRRRAPNRTRRFGARLRLLRCPAKTPPQPDETSPKALAAHEPQLEGVTKQERILTLLSRPDAASTTIDQFLANFKTAWREGEANPTAKAKAKVPRSRRRPDPLAAVNQQIESWFAAEPWRTAREFLDRLQVEHPQLYRDGHLRTWQRRLKVLRRQAAQSLVIWSKSDPDESGRLREDLKSGNQHFRKGPTGRKPLARYGAMGSARRERLASREATRSVRQNPVGREHLR